MAGEFMPVDAATVERLSQEFFERLASEGVSPETGFETLAATMALVGIVIAEYDDAKMIAIFRNYLDQIRDKKRRGESNTTITIPEISRRLGLSEETVYDMLKAGDIPNIHRRRLFIISRAAYDQWEKTIGTGKNGPQK
jgi:excisionase family DNA binding protein